VTGGVDRGGLVEGACECLEDCLDRVVSILRLQQPDVKGQPARARQRGQEFLRKNRVVCTDRLGRNLGVVHEQGATGYVKGDLGE
jgi:hypothetical protein